MGQAELFELSYEALYFMDSLFQMWLTMTFAAILAIYFTRTELSNWLRRLLISLYLAASIAMSGRWLVGTNHLVTYRDMIVEAGYPPFPTPEWASVFWVLHASTFLVGTITTAYFMHSFSSKQAGS